MARPYFRNVPNFSYVSREKNSQNISDYTDVKNLFKRGKIRDEIFGNLTFFTKYKIVGDERPDNVAYKVYGDSTLDWIVLLSNNIIDIHSEWPISQESLDKILLEKYGSYETLYSGIHHYETQEVKDSSGSIILKSGIKLQNNWKGNGGFVEGIELTGFNDITYDVASNKVSALLAGTIPDLKVGDQVIIKNVSDNAYNGTVIVTDASASFISNEIYFIKYIPLSTPSNSNPNLTFNEKIEYISNDAIDRGNQYYYQYFDSNTSQIVTLPLTEVTREITNYEYEIDLEDKKREIFLLKPQYLNVVYDDLASFMPYKKGSLDYVSETLKKGDNIRLY